MTMFRLRFAIPAVLLIGVLAAPAGAFAQTGPKALQVSSNWSGYVAGNAYYTGVSSLIQAPLPSTLQSIGFVASWVGIGGSTSDDLIQAGVEEVNRGPFVGYAAWYEMLPEMPRAVVMDVEPGAWVLFDVHEVAFNRWQITIVNGTNVFQTRVNYASSHSSAEWVVEDPSLRTGELLPLAGVVGANFAQMSAVANGVKATPVQLFPQSVGIINPAGAVKAAPSNIGSDGASFSVATV